MDKMRIKAFIDENGNNALDVTREGTQELFITVAILVPDNQYPHINQQMNDIITQYCGGHLKSNNIRTNHQRRIKILEAIQKIDFGYYAFIVNKKEIFEDSGLSYKRSFYKFIHKKIYEKLGSSCFYLEVYADAIGGPDFMESFEEYFHKKSLPNLFFNFQHQFVKDEDFPLIQLADFIAGTLSYCFEPSRKSEYSSRFRELLCQKEIDINFWPPVKEVSPAITDNSFDGQIYQFVMNKAIQLAEELNSASVSSNSLALLKVLRILIFNKLYEEDRTVTVSQLRQQLQNNEVDVTENIISRDILPSLRDKGIIISGTYKGYRLATSAKQIQSYIQHNKDIILPMLHRLDIARTGVKLATANRLDIIDPAKEKELSRILNLIKIPF